MIGVNSLTDIGVVTTATTWKSFSLTHKQDENTVQHK